MARILTVGFETGTLVAETPPEGATAAPSVLAGTPAASTSAVRSGSYSLNLPGGSSARFGGMPNVSGVPYYHRVYVRFTAWPAAGTTRQVCGRANGYSLRVDDIGRIGLWLTGGATLIGTRATISLNTWYRAEYMQNINTAAGSDDSGEFYLDGVLIASETNAARATAISTNFDIGDSTAGVMGMDVDDVAVNDNTGSAQNGYPGPGAVALLKPISDNARVDWTDGAGGTTNLYDAVNNIPPVGKATASSGATDQIEDATNGTTDTYDANCETPATAGIRGEIKVAVAMSRAAAATTTAQTTGVQGVTPAITEVTRSTGTTAAATEPTGWTTNKTAPVYSPSLALTASPVVRVRKATNVATIQAVSLMGLLVEHVTPAPPLVSPLRRRLHRNNR